LRIVCENGLGRTGEGDALPGFVHYLATTMRVFREVPAEVTLTV
jgi:hypothetical protein